MSICQESSVIKNDTRSLLKKIKTLQAREQRLRREMKKLSQIIDTKGRNIEKWKKRYYCLRNKNSEESPLRKRVQAIENLGIEAVRKHLLIGEVLKEQLQKKKDRNEN